MSLVAVSGNKTFLKMNSSNTRNFENSSDVYGDFYVDSQQTTIPFWILICYYLFILLGVIINFMVFIVLFRCKRNGILSSVLQMAAVDVISTYVGLAETWTLNQRTWIFPVKLCSFYLASEVLLNTFILYQIICLNFHIISTVNLRLHQTEKESKNPLQTYNSNDESEQCLVSTSENQTAKRNVVIDYRRKKSDLSIVFPSILVWFICLSVSVPEYTLSQAISISNNCTLCTIIDIHYRQLLQNLLMVFRTAVPLPLLLLLLLVLIKKLYECKFSYMKSQNILTRKIHNVQLLLMLGLCLTFVYIVMSVQRQLFHLLHTLNQDISNDNSVNSFKMPPLENISCSYLTNLISAMVHYGSSTLRGMIYVAILPELKNSCCFRKFLCLKTVN